MIRASIASQAPRRDLAYPALLTLGTYVLFEAFAAAPNLYISYLPLGILGAAQPRLGGPSRALGCQSLSLNLSAARRDMTSLNLSLANKNSTFACLYVSRRGCIRARKGGNPGEGEEASTNASSVPRVLALPGRVKCV